MAKIKKKKKVLKTSLIRASFAMPLCFFIIAFIVYTAVNYTIDIYSKYREKEELDKDLLALKDKEQKLTVDVEKLQDPEYVGRYLREKFLYSKQGEYIIKLPHEEKK